MPDWSPDGKTLLFVMPQQVPTWKGSGFGETHNDDDHVFGGSLYTAPYMGNGAFGAPVALITSAGENNYYPSFSPDGAFIIFNRVPLTGMLTACTKPGSFGNPPALDNICPNDSFSNPKARVFILSTKPAASPLDCEQANGSPAANPDPVGVSNSWPRWSPFVQTYHGSKLLWVTFSSTRDYGLLVRNYQTGMFQCYPPDSFQQPAGSHFGGFPTGCRQPQIWMAAINLSSAEVSTPTDPSFPAFWLPFQDIKTHNHTAQWTETVATQPPPDMGACIMAGDDCSANPNGCCNGLACSAQGKCPVG
jgi:hypothetical protein